MRRSLLISAALHALGIVFVSVALRPRFTVPPRLQSIPVSFVALAAPGPALVKRAGSEPHPPVDELPVPPAPRPREQSPPRPVDALHPSVNEEVKPRSSSARTRPTGEAPISVAPRREEPHREPGSASTSPPVSATDPVPTGAPSPPPESRRQDTSRPPSDLPRQGSADTSQVISSELPRIGDRRGAMEMQVEGEALPYSYYLVMVQRKIASFWEPLPGIDQQKEEVAAVVRFRIEKDGAVQSSYIEEPSGIVLFDNSALRALRRALPLPPLPQEFPDDHLIIHLRFVYSRTAAFPVGNR
jgi:TonB family protein